MKFITFLLNVINVHVVDILDLKEQLQKFWIVDFTGKQCLNMPMNFVKVANNVRK
jgi:hypothetical protein